LEPAKAKLSLPRYLQLPVLLLAIVGCLLVIRCAATYGFSHVLISYALSSGNIAAARKAAELTPKDAESHFAYAAVLSLTGAAGANQSVQELETAVALRPADYRLWSELGLMRDQVGNTEGALQAYDAAIARAPFYSKPRWQRGNVLLRAGQLEAAFKDLNAATQSDADLMPALIDLTWGLSRGDVQLTEQLAEINTEKRRLAFARLLARRGKAADALAQLRYVNTVPTSIKGELVDLLLAKNAFKEAFAVWHGDIGAKSGNEPALSVLDGGFEAPLSFGERGFGWRLPRDPQAASVYVSSNKPHSGTKNLAIDYSGNASPGVLLSQVILVEPSKRYQINFAARSENVVSGGLPLIVIADAADNATLGQSPALSNGTSNWRVYSFGFTTAAKTTAVLINLQREQCATQPCPIFGTLSLDSFSVQPLK
jgi:tetratricopeptide (TPR) repeat protein